MDKRTVHKRRQERNARATVKRKACQIDTSTILDDTCDVTLDPRNISEHDLRQKRKVMNIRIEEEEIACFVKNKIGEVKEKLFETENLRRLKDF